MFFYLSKILMFLISPVVWIVILITYSFITKKLKRKRRSLLLGFLLLLIFTNSFLLDEVMRAWELPAIKVEEIVEPYDYGIVLGGIIEYDAQLDRINFMGSTDRINQAIDLYNQGKIKKIFISGGSGSIIYDDFKEGEILRKYLIRIGIPEDDVLHESKSKNTHENAMFTAQVLPDNVNDRYLLITSAFHMRRALGCFEKAGIKADPFVTNRYSGQRKFVFDHVFMPNVNALQKWDLLIHEITGYVTYSIVGYI